MFEIFWAIAANSTSVHYIFSTIRSKLFPDLPKLWSAEFEGLGRWPGSGRNKSQFWGKFWREFLWQGSFGCPLQCIGPKAAILSVHEVEGIEIICEPPEEALFNGCTTDQESGWSAGVQHLHIHTRREWRYSSMGTGKVPPAETCWCHSSPWPVGCSGKILGHFWTARKID